MVYILFCRVQLDVVDLNWEYWESHCRIQGLQLVKSLQAANAVNEPQVVHADQTGKGLAFGKFRQCHEMPLQTLAPVVVPAARNGIAIWLQVIWVIAANSFNIPWYSVPIC